MKRLISLLILTWMLFSALNLNAQNPPHPNEGGAPNPGNNIPVGNGAPLGNGLPIMLAMAGLYVFSKYNSANGLNDQQTDQE